MADLASEVTALGNRLLDTDRNIDEALAHWDERQFRVWCKRRASLAGRLQALLLQAAITQ